MPLRRPFSSAPHPSTHTHAHTPRTHAHTRTPTHARPRTHAHARTPTHVRPRTHTHARTPTPRIYSSSLTSRPSSSSRSLPFLLNLRRYLADGRARLRELRQQLRSELWLRRRLLAFRHRLRFVLSWRATRACSFAWHFFGKWYTCLLCGLCAAPVPTYLYARKMYLLPRIVLSTSRSHTRFLLIYKIHVGSYR